MTPMDKARSDYTEWAIWFNQHKDNDRGLADEMKFIKRALDGAMACQITLLQAVQSIEGTAREQNSMILRPDMFLGGDTKG